MRRGYMLACVALLAGAGAAAAAALLGGAMSCHRAAAPAARSPNEAGQQPGGAASTNEPPQTAEACRACNGDFGVHGLSQTPACLCRTHDAGKRCRGKDDCEADCLGDPDDAREVTEPGPPPRGYFLGRCAEFRTSFGCHRFLPPRGAPPAPVRLDQPPDQLCVD